MPRLRNWEMEGEDSFLSQHELSIKFVQPFIPQEKITEITSHLKTFWNQVLL